jgi:hypothetical protein
MGGEDIMVRVPVTIRIRRGSKFALVVLALAAITWVVAASSAPNGTLVVDIAGRAQGHTFVDSSETVWVYVSGPDRAYKRLLGQRRFDFQSNTLKPIEVDLAAGDYVVTLLKNNDLDQLVETSCPANVRVSSGSLTMLHFPLPPTASCPDEDPFYWREVLENPDYISDAHAVMAEPVDGPRPIDLHWQRLDRDVTEMKETGCPETAAPMEAIRQQVMSHRPTEPRVFINGYAIGKASRPFLPPALLDMEFDADLIRLAVRDIKARCWNWFSSMREGDYGEEPSGDDLNIYRADQEYVEVQLAHLDRLNVIADILAGVAQRQNKP